MIKIPWAKFSLGTVNGQGWGLKAHADDVKHERLAIARAIYNASVNPPSLMKKELQEIVDELEARSHG